ncbi:DUF2799 domain-containing protein [Bdellovibrio svalbardensis]|uniref:DUF2799 domain-containing protein n=1 Tax=Bdellovibrio svalbardensis TaxID=2972972 RepID=A0ABT6DG47_9BACT|nr:DUF2799 domain-containing protein [Bdellovibrio svalbardensis]MDG0815225.1 DUF2799 domain-containing protein [Bdellovibrio svalbardensis]
MKRHLALSTFALICSINLLGCSSYFKRQECENINWFDHGQKVALRGEWLNADKTLQECRKAEANINETQLDQGFKAGMEQYCTPQKAYQIGKSGDLFYRGLCEGPSINSILAQHSQGIRDYCSKANSVAAGASGKKYQNVCPANLEKDFLPGYRRGRKRFVDAQILDKENQRQQINFTLLTKQSELNNVYAELNNLQGRRNFLEMQRSNALSAQNPTQAGYIDGQINALSGDISIKQNTVNSKNREVEALRKQQDQLAAEISNFRAELPSLEE